MKYYITTPIYYPNDKPHIGHAYTTLAADILARWHALRGYETFFLTGTDEHGKKLEEAAEKSGKSPKEFIDELIPDFKSAWEKFNIKYNRFIRTSEPEHEQVVKTILQKVYDQGDIYLGKYEGWYCTACEAYYTEKDLLENHLCPIHKKEAKWLEEDTYFFKLSKYEKQIKELLEQNIIVPAFRREEILNRMKDGLKDLSISRNNLKWGIPLPFDQSHVCYVWFDALTNYLTGIDYQTNKENFNKFWPADCHMMAKDILWFHSAIWFGILLAAQLPIPKKVMAHGFWTLEGEKISKTTGNYITPEEMINLAGVDPARYYLFSAMAFGNDGDISKQGLIEKNNTELANNLGNLVMRVAALIEKSSMAACQNDLLANLNIKNLDSYMANFEIHRVLEDTMAFVTTCNKFIDEQEVWKTKNPQHLWQLADSIKTISLILWPFMPETCEKIAKTYFFDIDKKWFETPLAENKISKPLPLFKKII